MAIRTLMALARVRRVLLEMGMEFIPAALGEGAPEQVSLEEWLHAPQDVLDGRTHLEMLDLPGGEGQVARALAQMLGIDGSNASDEGRLADE